MINIAHEKTMSSVALHDTDQRRGTSPCCCNYASDGASAFKAAALLQLTVGSSLHHLFSVRQFFKASPDGCQFYAKWKRDSVQPSSNLYLRVTGWMVIWKPWNKVWGLGRVRVRQKWQGKYTLPKDIFKKRMTKHPGWLLWKHLFQFNTSHTFRGSRRLL